MTPQQPPESCSECDECQFLWYFSHWECHDIGMVLDNDIYTTVHKGCPIRQ